MNRRIVLLWALVCILAAIPARQLAAQSTTTTLFGTVTDSSGAAVEAAQVTAINRDTNLSRTVPTSSSGEYRIEFLPVGNYSLEVSAPGFKRFVQKGIVLEVSQTARADAKLDLGNVSEIVSVRAEIPLVNTANPELGRTVENAEITNLPLVNRNVYSLLDLTPGVQRNDSGIVFGYPEQRVLINGGVDAGSGSVSYYLDGGTNMNGLRNTGNIVPNPDAVQEFRVQTNAYNAEYGRFANGVVNVITKSGSNHLHGSLFEFARNTIFNADEWNNKVAKAPMHRNQFGGTVGGPIRRDKTFFFGSYGGLRQNIGTFLTGAVVPTALERTGDFRQTPGKLQPRVPFEKIGVSASTKYPGQTVGQPFRCNPATGLPTGPGQVDNVICPSYIDPTAKNILARAIPAANNGATGWQGTVPNPFNTNEFLAKVDHNLNDAQRLTLSYFETSGSNTVKSGGANFALPWSVQQFNWRQHNANVSETWVISPNKVNQVWLSYMRNFGGRLNLTDPRLGLPAQATLADFGSGLTVQGTPSLPNISVSGFFNLAQSIAGPVAGTNFYSLRDAFSYTHGRHSLKFGGEVSLDKDIHDTLLNNYATLSFNGSATEKRDPDPKQAFKGSAFADFLLGIPNQITQDAPVTAYTNSWYTALFLQDDFRIHPRLTLNLGFRWDVQTPPTDPLNREASYVPGVQSAVRPNAPVGQLFVGDPGITRGVVPVRWKHFSPRLGFAWDPFGDSRTSIRAAAGLFYGSLSGNNWNQPTNFEPFATRLTFPNTGGSDYAKRGSLSCPYHGLPAPNTRPVTCNANIDNDPFPYNGAYVRGGGIFGIAPDFQWPYTYQLNFSVQRQIVSSLSVTAAYVGSLSHNLPFARDANYPLLTPGATTGNVLDRRPNQGFGPVLLVQSNQTASYHGAQFSVVERLGAHFTLNAFYTYSKSFTSVQLDSSQTAGGAQNMFDLRAERGRADIDQRHVFSASAVWQPEYAYGGNSFLRGALNGWSISPIVRLRSGLPFTVLNGRDANLDGTNNDRAQLVGNPLTGNCKNGAPVGSSDCWFNNSAFQQNCFRSSPAQIPPCVPSDGNSPRNLLDRPGFRTVDLAVARSFRLRESLKFELRVEGSNIFNMVNLDAPSATVTDSKFGRIDKAQRGSTGSGTFRQLQLGARITF